MPLNFRNRPGMPSALACTLALGLAASVSACTTRTVVKSEAPADAPATPDDEGPDTEAPPVDTGPWEEAPELPSEVRALSCPTDDDVYAATAKGLYRLDGDAWTSVAPGDFHAVSVDSGSRGYAGGDRQLLQLGNDGWGEIDGAGTWLIRGLYTDPGGVWVVASGWTFPGQNQLPIEPKAIYVRDDLQIPPERFFGSRLTAGTVASISGSGSTVVIGGSVGLLERWTGSSWAPLGEDYFLTGPVVSTSVSGPMIYVTNGTQIAMPGGSRFDPVGQTYDIRHLFNAGSTLVAVGGEGSVLVRTRGGDYVDDPPPADVDLVAGCATKDRRAWVGGGTKVFGRNGAVGSR